MTVHGNANGDGFFRRELRDGVRLVGQAVPGRRSVAIGIWIGVGSRDEEPGREGAAHFIEHLVFKGTRRRTAAEIAGSLERVGGSLDAFTTKETTCFYARVLEEHLELAVDVLCDLVSDPRFDPGDVDTERLVVEEELKSAIDTPEDLVGELSHRHLWPGNILGHSILGTPGSLAGLGPGEIRGFHQREYRTPRIVVSATGSVDPGLLERLLTGRLGLAAGDPGSRRRRPAPSVPTLAVHESDLSQVYLVFAGDAPPDLDEAKRPVQLLCEILGGGMSSRLFQTVREQEGLAYSVSAYSEHFQDTGMIGISLGVSPERSRKAVECTVGEVRRLLDEGLRAGELDAAKAQVRGSILMGLESLSNLMFRLARNEDRHRRPQPVEETLARFDAISESEVLDVARNVFEPSRLSLVALGPARVSDLAFQSFERTLEETVA